SIIFILLIGGIVGTTWGMIRANRAWEKEADRAAGEMKANAQAQKRLQQIEKGSEVLASGFTDLDPREEEKEGKQLRTILGERPVQAAQQLEGEGIGDRLIVAGLQNRLALSLRNMGMAERAIPLYEKAMATRASNLGADHPSTLESMNNLAASYRG